MSLAQEFKEQWAKDLVSLPYLIASDTADELNLELVHTDILATNDWTNRYRDVYRDNALDRYVAVEYYEANGEQSLDPSDINLVVYDVVPQQVSRIVYQRV